MSVALYGNYTRKLFQVWSERAESSNRLPIQAVPFTFHDMDIFPSSSQVHEMLQCASDCSKRQNGDYLTFGEFCVYASELKSCYENKVPRPIPFSKSRRETRKSASRRLASSGSSKFEVFLGGSCNPTTWRTDIAIPTLKSFGISYYNPQVAHWGPELIEQENQAKQNAEVMFFVIDNQTRSVASMIEAAHIAGTRRKLILVIHHFESPGSPVMGEPITEKEFMDLQQGQRYLQDLVERQGIPVFQTIPQALACILRVLKDDIQPQDLTVQDAAHPVKLAHLPLGDKLIKFREVFDDLDTSNSGEITLSDVGMAFKILTCQDLPVDNLKAIIEAQQGYLLNGTDLNNIRITFEEFCCIMIEFKKEMENGHNFLDVMTNKASHLFCSVLQPLSRLFDWVLPKRNSSTSCHINCNGDISFSATYRDVYLGGSGKPSTWREDIAIPLLKKKGLTFFSPQDDQWNERFIPLEAAEIENCRTLLFVITSNTRALAPMTVAAHYVGQNCNVVLCVQYIEDGIEINREKLSNQAVKDYNRGRVYLSDLANRQGIPVFDNIEEAVECIAEKCLPES